MARWWMLTWRRQVFIQGPGADGDATASAILSDIRAAQLRGTRL